MHSATHTRTSRIAVVHAAGHFRVVAAEPIPARKRILAIRGVEVGTPSRTSVQVEEEVHVEVPPHTTDLHEIFERYPWRFLNHSCAPSGAIRGRAVVAIRAIAPGDEITFDYNTTEVEMASPFACRCGACDARTVGGFLRLAPAERERLRPLLAPHLLRLLA